MNRTIALALTTTALLLAAQPAFAQDAGDGNSVGTGIAIGLAVLGGGLGQGLAARAALEGVARNPAASGKILVPMILGLALIESLVLLAWLVAANFV